MCSEFWNWEFINVYKCLKTSHWWEQDKEKVNMLLESCSHYCNHLTKLQKVISNKHNIIQKYSSEWCLNEFYLFPAYMYAKQAEVNYKYTHQDSMLCTWYKSTVEMNKSHCVFCTTVMATSFINVSQKQVSNMTHKGANKDGCCRKYDVSKEPKAAT